MKATFFLSRHRWVVIGAVVFLIGIGAVSCFFRNPDRWGGPLSFIPQGAAAGYNVLLITLDTTRADHLGCYGHAQAATPVLDRLAVRGIRFADAVTVAPVTLPSHATIFTGLWPPHHGVRHNAEYHLAAAQDTLAERLHDAGYETAAFISAFVLDARFGLSQGFDHYDDRVEVARGGAFPAGTQERSAQDVTDAAIAWLQQRVPVQPFFAWVHYFDPHAPYQPPPPFAARFQARLYDGEIAYVDAQIGRLLATLEEQSLAARTIILVVGDHGEGLGEHGEISHALFLYDSVLQVPLILALPGILQAPTVVADVVVSTADVFPTLLDLLGVVDDQRRDGVSLLRQGRDPERNIYVESLSPYLDYGWAPLFGVRRHHDKYILAPRPEYYDLRADPEELHDLYATAEGAVRRARDAQDAALKGLLAQWPAFEKTEEGESPVSPETVERLRSLGYLSGAGPVSGSLRHDPKDMTAVVTAIMHANALLAAGQALQALAVMQPLAVMSSQDRSVLHTLAKIYLRLGRLKDAETALRTFTAIKPKADVSLLLAQIVMLDGRYQEAEQLLDQAAQREPQHGGVLIARGDLHAMQGRSQEARALYEQALQRDPYRATGLAKARIAKLRQTILTP